MSLKCINHMVGRGGVHGEHMAQFSCPVFNSGVALELYSAHFCLVDLH